MFNFRGRYNKYIYRELYICMIKKNEEELIKQYV